MKVEKFTPVPEQSYKLELNKREYDDIRVALYWAKKANSGAWEDLRARIAVLHGALDDAK